MLAPWKGFPDISVAKVSTCNVGDPGSIPGLGRSPGEGTGYPLQCSWASLVAQLVKNPPAMWETWVQSLSSKAKATHSSILAWRIPWTVHRVAKSRTLLGSFHFHFAPWKKSYDKPRQHIKKQKHYFTNKGLSSQSYGFSNSHVWMWVGP